MGGARGATLLVVASAACSRLAPLEIPLPVDPAIASRLILVERDGSRTDSVMLGANGEGAAALPVIAANETSHQIRIVAIGFAQTLEALGLEPGALKLASASDLGARKMPQWIQAEELISDHATATAWEPLDPSRTDPAKLFLPPDTRCFSFRQEEIALTTTRALGAWERLVDGSILIGVRDQIRTDLRTSSWFVVGTDRIVRSVEPPAGHPYISRVYADPVGTLWMGDDDGGLWSGQLHDGKLDAVKVEQVVPSVPGCVRGIHLPCEGNNLVWITGPKSAAEPFELFIMTVAGDVFRRDAAGPAQPIFSFQPVVQDVVYAGGLLWLGPSQLVAVLGRDSRIHFWDHGADTHLEINGEPAFLTVGQSSTLGLAVASADRVYSIDRTSSRLLLDAAPSVRAIADFPNGFLLGRGGSFVEQVTATGRCGERQLGAGPVFMIAPFGDGWILISDHQADGQELAVAILHRDP